MEKKISKEIEKNAKELSDFMKENLYDIAASIISKIMISYRNNPDFKRFDAIKNINAAGVQSYKSSLADAVAIIARDAINQAKKEVPARVKFSEYDNLPASVRKAVDSRGELTVISQLSDLEKAIYFAFINNVDAGISEKELESTITEAATSYIEGPAIATGAELMTSAITNTARMEYFELPDVSEKISGYEFVNADPKSAICQELAGHIFPKDSADLDYYRPPLHFNCKSYLVPVFDAEPKDFENLTLTKAAQNAIQFSENIICGCDKEYSLEEIIMPDITNPRPGNLQTIIISKDQAKSLDDAKKIAKDVGADKFEPDETSTSYRFRQRNPGDFIPGSFRSFKIEKKGATLIYGKLK